MHYDNGRCIIEYGAAVDFPRVYQGSIGKAKGYKALVENVILSIHVYAAKSLLGGVLQFRE